MDHHVGVMDNELDDNEDEMSSREGGDPERPRAKLFGVLYQQSRQRQQCHFVLSTSTLRVLLSKQHCSECFGCPRHAY